MAKTSKKTITDFPSKAAFREWQKRSKASKKGWKTRYLAKANKIDAVIENVKRHVKKLPPKKRTKKPKPKHMLRESKLEKELRNAKERAEAAEKKLEELELYLSDKKVGIDTSTWIDAWAPNEKRLFDGGNSMYASDLRLVPKAWDLHYELKKAEKKGFFWLHVAVHEMAEQYGVGLREVFTLLYSP